MAKNKTEMILLKIKLMVNKMIQNQDLYFYSTVLLMRTYRQNGLFLSMFYFICNKMILVTLNLNHHQQQQVVLKCGVLRGGAVKMWGAIIKQ